MRNSNNKRMRGRNNRGGKGPNPLSRSYESNGPDVKIRGTAQHIAEKYLQLARDAHSSGDPVAAESYLQHAEHYFRIIAAAHVAEKYLQLARDAQSSGDPVLAENYLQHAEHYFRIVAAAQPQNQFRPDQPGQMQDVDEDDDFPPINDRFASPEPRVPFQPQPQQQGDQPGFVADGEEGGEGASAQAAAVPQGEVALGEDGQPLNAQAGEGEGRRHRDRNRRRRGRGQGEGGQAGGDPANAPQPDVGELPAFLTAGGPPPAAE